MTEPMCVELSHRQDYRHSLGQNSPFYEALSVSKMMGTQCETCQRLFVPPRTACVVDGAPAKWVDVGDFGTLVAFTEISRRPTYAAAGPAHLILGLVQLDGAATAVLAEIVDAGHLETGGLVRAVYRSATTHPAQQLSFTTISSSDQEEAV